VSGHRNVDPSGVAAPPITFVNNPNQASALGLNRPARGPSTVRYRDSARCLCPDKYFPALPRNGSFEDVAVASRLGLSALAGARGRAVAV